MKILVTGASGYVGATLVPLLLQQQHQLTIVTRAAAKLPQAWAPSVEIIEGDLCKAAVCEQAVAGMDAVMHLAGLAHVSASWQRHQQENFLNTRQLALAALAAGVQVFVYVSSSKANFPDHSSYGKYKRDSEAMLLSLAGAMAVVCLRPGIIYGAGMRNNLRSLLRLLSRPALPIFVRSANPISMISTQDCCRAIMAALTNPALAGKVWELNDGETYTLAELVIQVRRHLQLPLPLFYAPRWLAGLALAGAGVIPALRKRGLGLHTYRALYCEPAALTAEFAVVSGIQPSSRFYELLPELLVHEQ
ncbi:MAG: NAD-dependent epimerase/dehydratase family protein [Gammaproteobacteria bacterium]